ncbi:MAG: ABC transporter ATP-binding protein [Verrucomicrobia bacterium]|nr:ABC transporter ATP-binding protein [Verrucomicrobiota bacterium]
MITNPTTTPASSTPSGQPPSPPVVAAATKPRALSRERFRVVFNKILDLARAFLRPELGLIIGYMILAYVGQTVLPMNVGLRFGELTNAVGGHGATAGVSPADGPIVSRYLVWFGLSILMMGTSFSLRYLSSYLDGKISNRVRQSLFDQVLHESPDFFAEYDADRLTTIVNQFASQAALGLRQILVDPLFQVTGMLTAGWTLYYKLQTSMSGSPAALGWFLVILVFALISPVLVIWSGKRLTSATKDMQAQLLSLATLVGGAVKAPEEIQAMRAEPTFQSMYGRALHQLLSSRLKQTVSVERLNFLNQLPGFMVQAALIGIAVLAIATGGHATPGDLVAIALVAPVFMNATQSLAGVGVNFSMTWPTLELIDNIRRRRPAIVTSETAREYDALEPTLAFKHVVFSYPGQAQRPVLNNVSFDVPNGAACGLVAKMGQGKTTLFRLTLRFLEPQAGEILIGGVPHREMSLASLRRHVVLMAQFPAFFHGSIAENFRLARPEATDAEIEALCRETILWETLCLRFGENPLAAPFGAGARLSGGQKKLFALTRSLLRRPTILLLDEPTTGVDPNEKYALVPLMKRACAGRTVVVVDHDIVWLSKFCDRLAVLDGGLIVQQGTPAELVSQPGLFRDLYLEATQSEQDPASTGHRPASPSPRVDGARVEAT